MATETYKIVRNGDSWAVDHDGTLEGEYSTKQAAFDSAVGAAANAIKDGLGISITVDAPASGESALGGKV
jgi:hypothetical protein